ncbi:hypothetical protein AVEN_56479-1 [Araneus ventricosus]|uniref:Uncharacterized protein n=1 Tax=Araneus ventricosus TaxID=182803 RepID=A0A4Y2TDS5_ARAVE|nr:hypothetical protein AVEN_56479-1 [Araneus ventricosus]
MQIPTEQTKIRFPPRSPSHRQNVIFVYNQKAVDFRTQKKLCFPPKPFPGAHKQNNTDKKSKPSIFPLTNRTFDKPFPYENHSLRSFYTPLCWGERKRERSDDDYHP